MKDEEKSEIRSTKSETNPKFERLMIKTGLDFLDFGFRFVSDFEFRISDLGLWDYPCPPVRLDCH